MAALAEMYVQGVSTPRKVKAINKGLARSAPDVDEPYPYAILYGHNEKMRE